eukprot:jgi/Mesvir1/6160/Mv00856-RA.4
MLSHNVAPGTNVAAVEWVTAGGIKTGLLALVIIRDTPPATSQRLITAIQDTPWLVFGAVGAQVLPQLPLIDRSVVSADAADGCDPANMFDGSYRSPRDAPPGDAEEGGGDEGFSKKKLFLIVGVVGAGVAVIYFLGILICHRFQKLKEHKVLPTSTPRPPHGTRGVSGPLAGPGGSVSVQMTAHGAVGGPGMTPPRVDTSATTTLLPPFSPGMETPATYTPGGTRVPRKKKKKRATGDAPGVASNIPQPSPTEDDTLLPPPRGGHEGGGPPTPPRQLPPLAAVPSSAPPATFSYGPLAPSKVALPVLGAGAGAGHGVAAPMPPSSPPPPLMPLRPPARLQPVNEGAASSLGVARPAQPGGPFNGLSPLAPPHATPTGIPPPAVPLRVQALAPLQARPGSLAPLGAAPPSPSPWMAPPSLPPVRTHPPPETQ